MSNFEIPDFVRLFISRLSSFDDQSVEQLSKAFKEHPPADAMPALINDITSSAPLTAFADVRECVRCLVFGYAASRRLGLDSLSFGKLLADKMMLTTPSSVNIDLPLAGKRFGQLLASATAVNLLAKTEEVTSQLPRRLSDVRILTDMRPIFGDEISQRPAAAVILHTLALTYCEADEMKQFHVTLDEDGLAKLHGALERANWKQRSLEATMKDHGLRILSRRGVSEQ